LNEPAKLPRRYTQAVVFQQHETLGPRTFITGMRDATSSVQDINTTYKEREKDMKLIKYDNLWNDPLAEFDSMLSRVFNDRSLLPSFFGTGFEDLTTRSFRTDIFADDEGYRVVAELPGVPKEAIDVKLENAVLTISGERKTGEGESQRTLKFSRSITVGDDVNPDGVSAKLENGLLTVSLPKIEERKPRMITVK